MSSPVSSPTSSPTAFTYLNNGLSNLAYTMNNISTLAQPIESDVGAVSQVYTQIKQMNPMSKTNVPVNAAYYQGPQGQNLAINWGVTGNQLESMALNMPWFVWAGGAAILLFILIKDR